MNKYAPANVASLQLDASKINGTVLEYRTTSGPWTVMSGSVSNGLIGAYSVLNMGGVTACHLRALASASS